MSAKNNVNTGHYKVAGRDKPDDQARERMKGARSEATKNVPPHRKAKSKKAR